MILTVTSHEIINGDHLRLKLGSDNQPFGTIDFISGKINFNITGRYFFKGMEWMENIQTEYSDGKLIFTFSNKKKLVISCGSVEFEKVTVHFKTYQDVDENPNPED